MLATRGGGLLNWIGSNPLPILLSLLILAGGAWGFIELADEVLEGATQSVDERILLAMRTPGDPATPIGPPWLAELGRDVTALGGVAVLTTMVLISAGYLLLAAKYRSAVFMVLAVAGGLVLSSLLKLAIDRPRPELVSHESLVYTASFPSGHAMMAAVTYLTLAVMLARVQPRRRLKAYLLLVALLITVAVGLSRIYVGVHWPSDVLAGWTAGAAWAALCWLVALWLQRSGRVEPADQEP
ncbi:phosphatase PAP2 family protein [Ectothiorhodospiraceae bacterium 2226]|nr:phosphatase PAP2 family protein [Ectothiorhodospiraceae bacterium 2226]